jgi:hypothetical protein
MSANDAVDGASATQGSIAMNDKIIGLEQNEEDLLINEISDEALEIAAGTAKEITNYTLGSCTDLSLCPV